MKQLRLQTIDEAERLDSGAQSRDEQNPMAVAYSYGWRRHLVRQDAKWDESEAELREGWEAVRANPGVSWDEACEAIRQGWDHVTPPPRARQH